MVDNVFCQSMCMALTPLNLWTKLFVSQAQTFAWPTGLSRGRRVGLPHVRIPIELTLWAGIR